MVNYWKIAPGKEGYLWVEQRDHQCIAVGWDETGPLDKLKTERAIRTKFKEFWPNQSPKQLLEFYTRIKRGDRVLASAGHQIFGLGTVDGKYKFDEELWFEHSIPVRWETTFWEGIGVADLKLPQKTSSQLWPRRPPTLKELNRRQWEQIERAVFRFRSPFQNVTNLEGLSAAPRTEQETIILFSRLSQHLKMRIEKVGTRFPDAIVRVKKRGKWISRAAEFELNSSGFRSHLKDYQRDPNACDMIICWEHNWDKAPRKLEVVELRKELLNAL